MSAPVVGGSDARHLVGRTAIVTGTGGLGLEVAQGLAARGAELVIAGRDRAKGDQAVQAVKGRHPGARIRFELLDLADLGSIRSFAERMTRADILVNNAGVMTPPTRRTTADGFELQFGTNHLGHFALTAQLLPLLKASGNARVTSVGSLAHRSGRIDFDNLQAERRYKPFAAYAQSKLACVMFALELRRRSEAQGWGIMSNAAHPGYARTDLIANGPGSDALSSRISRFLEPWISHSAADGAAPLLFAASSPDARGGAYYGPTGVMELKGPVGEAKIVSRARDAEVAHRLWDISGQLTGVHFG
jgi:NAD(P)-dependent dehydrogenase (short-subunit alcohol dehydrogenase family)